MKFQLERILLFSDAVFAIAITLMIIEVKPPHLPHGVSFSDAFQIFSQAIPMIVGTILSFVLIGVFWKWHHQQMRHVQAYDFKFIRMNLSLLLSIAFIPFSTGFVFENLASHSPLPLVIYNLNYIISSLFAYRMFNYALNPANKLCSVNASDVEELRVLKIEMLFPVVVYVLVIVLAFINPDVAGLGYIVMAFQNKVAKKFK